MLEFFGVFYRGLVLGLMISAPVGPIGLLCLRRTASMGLATGLATGMGAATADAIFGALAAFGVAAILDLMTDWQAQINIVGGILLLGMAWAAWHKATRLTDTNTISAANIARSYFSGLVLTCTNPVTIVATIAVIAALGGKLQTSDAWLLTFGVFVGAAGWWLTLSGLVALFRNLFSERVIIFINRCTGVLLYLIALYAIISGLKDILADGRITY